MVEATANVALDVPLPPLIEDGLKPTVTPAGMPDAVRAMAVSNPSDGVAVMVEVPLLPAATVSDAGDAARVKDGDVLDEPVSAAIRPEFGLPHPVTRSYPVTAE